MKINLFEWINTAADFIVYLLKGIFSIVVSVFVFIYHSGNKLFWHLLDAYPTGSKVVLALLAIFTVILISYPRATIDLLGYIFLGRFFKDHSSKKVPSFSMSLVQQYPEESLMGKKDTTYTIAPMETEEFLTGEDLSYIKTSMGEDFASLKVEGQKKKLAVCASKWKEFANTHKAILDFFHDFSYFPSAQELYFLEKQGLALKDRWGNNVGVYTKNIPRVSHEKIDIAAKRMKILDYPSEFLRACHDVCRKGTKSAFGIWEGDHNFKHEMQILANRYGFLLEQSKIAAQPLKVEELPFIPHGIPKEKRFEHCTIIARPGWGKTRLMQALAYYDIKDHFSTVVIDSEGLFSDNILHLRDKGDLIYIDFTDPINVPCLSIFDIEFPDDPKEEDRVFGSVIELYGYVFESLMGATSTPRQIALLQFLSELMLKIPGASLRTMRDVILDDRSFQKDMKKLRGDAQEWFANRWPTKEWGEVKKQIMDRFDTIFADRILTRVFTQGKSKIDLYTAINLGKVIVVNVNSGHLGEESCSILGRFIIAMFMQAALRRKEGDPRNKPTFLYLDEAWRYFGGKEEKLSKMYRMIRKFNVGLVVASQQISHFSEVSMSLRNAAFQSAILFSGYLSDKEDREMVKELSLPKEATTKILQKVERVSSEFYCSIDGKPKKVVIPLDVMEKAPRLTDKEVNTLLQSNSDRYCEQVRARKAKVEAGGDDETVLEPDEQGVLRPIGLPAADKSDEFWQ